MNFLVPPPHDVLAIDVQIESAKLWIIRDWIRHHTSYIRVSEKELKEEREKETEEEEREKETEMYTDSQPQIPVWDKRVLLRKELWEHFLPFIHLHQLPIEVRLASYLLT